MDVSVYSIISYLVVSCEIFYYLLLYKQLFSIMNSEVISIFAYISLFLYSKYITFISKGFLSDHETVRSKDMYT